MHSLMTDLRIFLFLALLMPGAAVAVDSTFTYQGELTDAGQTVNGVVDLRFRIFDQPAGGMELDEHIALDVVVDDGRFTSPVTVAHSVFDGDERYIEIAVANPAGSAFEPLEPRQRISPAPYALFADDAPLDDPLPIGCNGGDIPVWDGSSWTCGSAGGDSVTDVIAGDGLTGGGSSGSVTLDADFAGTGTANTVARSDHDHDDRYYTIDELGQSGQGAAVHWDNLTDLPDAVENPPGETLGPGLIDNGGALSVSTLPMRGFTDTVVDSAGPVGRNPAIIIGVDGLALISYHDAGNGDLKVHHCDDTTCSTGTTTVVDSSGIVGEFSSVTIGRDGFGLISYYDRTNGDLKFAQCLNTACTSANTTAIDTTGNVGQYTSITTTDDGYGFITYYDVSNGDLKAARCTSLNCVGETIWTVDSNGDVGQYSSIVRSPRDYGYISYYDATNGDLKVARCVNMSCSNPSVHVADGTDETGGVEDDSGRWTSVTIGPDGLPVIVHARLGVIGVSSSQVRVTKCTTTTCSSSTTETVISGSNLDFQGMSITLGRYGLPQFSMTWSTATRVYMVVCGDPACDESPINDGMVRTGSPRETSLTIGADGLPIMAYHASSGDDLRVVHCSDYSCQPYLRRR